MAAVCRAKCREFVRVDLYSKLHARVHYCTLFFLSRYFILWLREYTERYSEWAMQSKRKARANSSAHPMTPMHYLSVPNINTCDRQRAYRTPPPSHPPPNPALAMFYLRAKQTFLTPNAPYELDVPSDKLSQFHVGPMGASFNWEELQGWGGGYVTNNECELHSQDPG